VDIARHPRQAEGPGAEKGVRGIPQEAARGDSQEADLPLLPALVDAWGLFQPSECRLNTRSDPFGTNFADSNWLKSCGPSPGLNLPSVSAACFPCRPMLVVSYASPGTASCMNSDAGGRIRTRP